MLLTKFLRHYLSKVHCLLNYTRFMPNHKLQEHPHKVLDMWPCTLQSGEEKSKYACLAQENKFCSYFFAQFAEAGERHSKVVHLPKKSVINMICLLHLVVYWPNIMIGPGGLLLVVATYLQSRFQFYRWRCNKINNNVKPPIIKHVSIVEHFPIFS